MRLFPNVCAHTHGVGFLREGPFEKVLLHLLLYKNSVNVRVRDCERNLCYCEIFG